MSHSTCNETRFVYCFNDEIPLAMVHENRLTFSVGIF